MNEINCPHCHKAFQVDAAGFADIQRQVRNQEFDKEIQQRLKLAENDKVIAVQLAEATLRGDLQAELLKKENEISELNAKNERELIEQLGHKDQEVAQLRSKIETADLEKQLLVAQSIKDIEKERDELKFITA